MYSFGFYFGFIILWLRHLSRIALKKNKIGLCALSSLVHLLYFMCYLAHNEFLKRQSSQALKSISTIEEVKLESFN
jgi:hypothetical protein